MFLSGIHEIKINVSLRRIHARSASRCPVRKNTNFSEYGNRPPAEFLVSPRKIKTVQFVSLAQMDIF